MSGLRLAWVDRRAALYACEHWHYSHTLPASRTIHLGVWEGSRFTGVILFSLGAAPHLGTRYGLAGGEVCELSRIALRDHQGPVSAMVSRALAMLKQTSPTLRLVVSFADQNQGHHGGVYQACNWFYLGETAAMPVWQDPAGRTYHNRVVSESGYVKGLGGAQKGVKRSTVRKVEQLSKHRYAYPLDRRMRRQLAPLALPYPRVRSLDGEAPTDLVGGAGSTPAGRL